MPIPSSMKLLVIKWKGKEIEKLSVTLNDDISLISFEYIANNVYL